MTESAQVSTDIESNEKLDPSVDQVRVLYEETPALASKVGEKNNPDEELLNETQGRGEMEALITDPDSTSGGETTPEAVPAVEMLLGSSSSTQTIDPGMLR
jgi:hypothetical protein